MEPLIFTVRAGLLIDRAGLESLDAFSTSILIHALRGAGAVYRAQEKMRRGVNARLPSLKQNTAEL